MNEPEFRSVFQKEFHDLISLKQSLGFKYEGRAQAFKRIDDFFFESGLLEKQLPKELCDRWCRKRSYESDANHASRVSQLRVFCKYVRSLGIPAYVPPHGLTRHPQIRCTYLHRR